MADFKIPGGPNKGQLLAEADDGAIQYWLKRRETELANEPSSEFAGANQRWIAAARAELEGRKAGGLRPPAASAPAPSRAAAPSTALQQRAPADIQTLGSSMHDPKAVTAKLQELAASYHLVSPATHVDGLPPGCGVAFSFVSVDPNDGKDGPGEVYSVGNKLGLSATTLSKIGAAAGISWDPRQSGRLDDGSDPHYCHFRAVGVARNFDGSMRVLTGEVEIDARDGSPQIDEIRQKAEARRVKNPSWANDGGAAQTLELRKFLLRHAERKAKSRAIADLGIKRAYTPAELSKPFAIARIMFTGESDDPELRKAFALRTADTMLGGMAALYGAPAPSPALAPPSPHHAPAPIPAPAQFLGHAPPSAFAPPRQRDAEPDSEPYASEPPEEREAAGY